MNRDKRYSGRKGKEPQSNTNLWCPFCNWHVTDSFSNRRRFGLHVGGCHYSQVVLPEGVEPDTAPEKERELP